MSRLTRDVTAEAVFSRDQQILRRERGQGNNINFPWSAAHDEQDWQLYPVDPYYFAIIIRDDHQHNIHTYIRC